ncbi:hypothetical protein NUW54_g1183 [Trametes sanguinea]|uniref:Uncharacterized protein n=1 Tax=Trametes sanguinea TaxID=158606 RepID=A0ACC1Q7A8_9APHY|nr:hypothetical protein NUW54_g1183 [Trametes sanguinea]
MREASPFNFPLGAPALGALWRHRSSTRSHAATAPRGTSTFTSKGVPWPIGLLLDDERNARPYGKDFAGGKFSHSFLNSTDYHRIHAPVAGEVLEARVIEGLCYLQVEAVPDNKGRNKVGIRRRLLAPDQPGFQFLQTRGLVLIKNLDVGLVAVSPVGMPQVASVVMSVKPGT